MHDVAGAFRRQFSETWVLFKRSRVNLGITYLCALPQAAYLLLSVETCRSYAAMNSAESS